jgi:hypothetical protein
MRHIDSLEALDDLLSSYKTCVVEFYFDENGSGKMLSHYVEKVATEWADVGYSRFNLAGKQRVMDTLGFKRLPIVVVFSNKGIHRVIEGFAPENQFRAEISKARAL